MTNRYHKGFLSLKIQCLFVAFSLKYLVQNKLVSFMSWNFFSCPLKLDSFLEKRKFLMRSAMWKQKYAKLDCFWKYAVLLFYSKTVYTSSLKTSSCNS